MQDKRPQLEPDMEQQTGSNLGREYIKAIYCHSAYLTYMQSTSYEMLGWMTHKLWSDCQEKYQQPQIYRWYHFNGRKWRRDKEPLNEGKRGEWKKAGLKLNIQKKIMASGPITSQQIDGGKWKLSDFIFLGSKINGDGDCSHKIKRCLLLGRKAMTNLDSILKSRDISLPTKASIVKAMAFPVVMHGCESWTVMKSECQRIDAFKLLCWRRLLRVPWLQGDQTSWS